ncbi:MAG: chromate resistance protein [Actinobacteria bacterium]|nr:MAG: chromate resistance protein [Actinomycetota bacterium]
MGMRSGVFSASIDHPPVAWFHGSVTLDGHGIKGYGRLDALADPLDDLAPHPDPASRRGVEKVAADGGRAAAWGGLDPARDARDDRALPVARPGNPVRPRRGDAASRRSSRADDRPGDRRPVPQGPERRVSGGDATNHRRSIPRLRGKLDGLKRELDRIQSIDYLKAPAGARARSLWETAAKRLRAAETRPRATGGGRHRTSLPPRGSTWVTRPRPHIDRIASAWLIKRFCDPDAKFAFADAADAARKGIPFDVLGADFGHHGEDCTFETVVKRFGIKDRRVTVIAEIVHEADLHDGKFTRNEAAGLDLAVNGLVEATPDDHELLERGMAIFEGLYTVLKQKA